MSKEIESILKIDPDIEFADMLTELNAKSAALKNLEPAKERVDEVAAVLNYYERQMAEPEPKPAKKRGIVNLKGIEVLVLDPMSRLYGLNENDNAHGTAWIQALERLALDYKLSIVFSHHEPKSASQGKSLQDSTGRGASSIRDGCRGAISMREMTESDGNKYDVNPREHVEIDVTKANYTAKLPSSIYLKRGEGGLLETVDLSHDRIKGLAEALIEELSAQSNPISRNDLQNNRGTAKDIISNLKATSSFKLKDMGKIIDYALEKGIIIEVAQIGAGRAKKILQVI